jgi:hypothetical protein
MFPDILHVLPRLLAGRSAYRAMDPAPGLWARHYVLVATDKALVHEAWKACSYPLVSSLFDTNKYRHAKVGHPIEDCTSASRLRLLIGQSAGVKAPSRDGLVAEHYRFNQAPSAIP